MLSPKLRVKITLFILACSLIAVFAVFAAPILAKQIQLQADIIFSNELRVNTACLGGVCKTGW